MVDVAGQYVFRDPDAYEAYMGRWSPGAVIATRSGSQLVAKRYRLINLQ
jgi:hypothetical protein